MDRNKRILALDQSTKETGWAIFENKKLINHGVISVSGADGLKRIVEMGKKVQDLIELYEPIYVVMEEVRPEDVNSNNDVFKKLMYLQGQLAIVCNSNGLKYEFLVPSEWRKQCGIKTGRGVMRDKLKASDIKFVKDTYDIVVSDDEADAIGIGYGFCFYKNDDVINFE